MVSKYLGYPEHGKRGVMGDKTNPYNDKIEYATVDEWRAEASRRFGDDPLGWRFVCPVCGYIASVRDWKAVGASDGEVAYSCIGRNMDKAYDAFNGAGLGPCNYAGGGLFKLNPITVDGHQVFAFAESE
jgi:hypothetical protein